MQAVFRFAPSPNGHLHLGHAYSALLNAQLAAEAGGRFIVRIEDIDAVRCTEQLVGDCLEDLAWLGLQWEQPVLRQSRHFARYRAVTSDLEAAGLLYPCFCSRREIAAAAEPADARDPDGAPLYPGTCRHLPIARRRQRLEAGYPHVLRLDMQRALERFGAGRLVWREAGEGPEGKACEMVARPDAWGDVVLVRKDCPTSYHLAVVLDDAHQGISHVVRGRDLFEATAIHRLLQVLLALPAPLYRHHALLSDRDGRKLAKSAASKSLRQWRAEGWSAQDIRVRLGFG